MISFSSIQRNFFQVEGMALTERKYEAKHEHEDLHISPVQPVALGPLVDARSLEDGPPLAHATSIMPKVWRPDLRNFSTGLASDFGDYGIIIFDWSNC